MPAEPTAPAGSRSASPRDVEGRSRYPLFIARRFVRARRQGFLSLISLLSAASFFVGVMSLILALGLMTGFQEDVIGRILDANASLIVQPADGTLTIPEPAALAQRVEAVPGVAAAAPVVHGYAVVIGPTRQLQFSMVTGIDPAASDRVIGIGRHMSEGRLAALGEPTASGRPGVVIGAELARRLGARPGDTVQLIVPRPKITPWGLDIRKPVFEVVGIFATGYNEYDTQWMFTGLATGQGLFDAAGAAHWIAVRARDLQRIPELRDRVGTALGRGWFVTDVLSSNRSFFSALKLEKLYMFLAVGLIVLVAALGVVSALILTVTQKVREIGVLVALGATPRGILQIFLYQGLAMGLLGTVGGAVVGVSLAKVLDHFRLIKLNPEIYYLDHLPFSVRAGDLGLIVGIAVLVAIVATLYPAWRAARLDPVEALRRD